MTQMMSTIEELEATRQLIINAIFTENDAEKALLMEAYNKECRAVGIDPETWEGNR